MVTIPEMVAFSMIDLELSIQMHGSMCAVLMVSIYYAYM